MRMEIEYKLAEDGLSRELWVVYYDFQKGIRLASVHHQSRNTRRHKWRTTVKWDSADTRSYNSRLEAPKYLPMVVLGEVISQVTAKVRDADVYIGWYNYESQVR